MKVLKIIGIVLLVVVLAVVVLMFIAPTDYRVERSISINAPKDVVKDQVVYFENARTWSPWEELDSDMKQWIEGQDGTVGAINHWEGNDKAGEGSQEIKLIEDNRVETTVNFVRPFESSADSYFIFDENESGTVVTWGFTSTMPRPLNIMGLFMNMEEAIGKDYEKGLEKLKAVSEAKAEEVAQKWKIETVDFPEQKYLAHRETIGFDQMKEFYGKHLEFMYKHISNSKNLEFAGSASGIYYDWDEENKTADVAAAMPFKTSGKDPKLEGYEVITLKGKALMVAYHGDYEKLGDAHTTIHEHLKKNGMEMSEVVLEEYVTDPTTEPDTTKWLTNVYYFVK